MKKICCFCEIEFHAERKERKYCSKVCTYKSYIGRKKKPFSTTHRNKLSNYAKNRTSEHRNKLGKAHKGEKAWNWKGNNVSYRGLHKWVNEHKKSNNLCEICNKKTKRLDLANKSGKYLRDLDDWRYLCRMCHMKSDGRYEKLLERNQKNNPMKSINYE